MSDTLRTRIAAVLPKIFDRIADGELVEWGDMADAVIRELKNDPSIMFMTHVCGEGCSCD